MGCHGRDRSEIPSGQDVPSIPLNVYRGPIEDAVSVSLVLGLQSSSMSVHRSPL